MTVVRELVVLDAPDQGSATCLVCGNDISSGEGVTARYGDRTLRFKCPGCLSRFEADPERYLAGQAGGCRKGDTTTPRQRVALRLRASPGAQGQPA